MGVVSGTTVSKQINELKEISREGTNMKRERVHGCETCRSYDVLWNSLENNSIPAGTSAIQSSLIHNFGVRLPNRRVNWENATKIA